MSNRVTTIALLFLLTAGAADTPAKSWRGIKPLDSTSKDVAKLSEACEKAETRCQFDLDKQQVMVTLSGAKVGDLECPGVPKQTVLAVILKFNRPQSLKKFQIKNKPFKVFDPSYPPDQGYKTYYYEKEGFLINTYQDQVIGLVYIASKADIHRCPQYYSDPKAFVEIGLVP